MKEDSGKDSCYLTPCNYTFAKEKAGIENPESCVYLIDGSEIGSECQVDALTTSPSSPVNVVTEVILNIKVGDSAIECIIARPARTLAHYVKDCKNVRVTIGDTVLDSNPIFYKYSLAAGQTPVCVLTSVHIWVKLDDKKVKEHLVSPFQTIRDLFPSLEAIHVTHGEIVVNPDDCFWMYEQTDKNKPVIIKSCEAVWVKYRDVLPRLERYSLGFTVEVITQGDYFGYLCGKVLFKDTELSSLTTE